MDLAVVTGFLGVGKTTFVLRMVRELSEKGMRVAIVVNDFGKVNVDGKVMEKYGLDVKELSGGCICCTLGPSLIITLRNLGQNFKPDLIILEPSGIADPESIRNVLDGYHGPPISSFKVAVVVDAERYWAFKKMMEKPFRRQIASADVILLNKIDLVGEGDILRISEDLREMGFTGGVIPISASEDSNIPEAVRSVMESS